MPMDVTRYPDNWHEIARAVKEAAGWKCQNPKCSIDHIGDGTMGSCLTVHHPDRDPENEPHARKIALCARCHLREGAKLLRQELQKDQLVLFEFPLIHILGPEELEKPLEDLVEEIAGIEDAAHEPGSRR